MVSPERRRFSRAKSASFWVGSVGIILAVVLYVFAIWSAIGNVILLPQSAAGFGLVISAYGWFWLILQLILPAILAGLALLLGRKRSVPVNALLLLAGVAVLSVFSIDMANSIPVTSYFG